MLGGQPHVSVSPAGRATSPAGRAGTHPSRPEGLTSRLLQKVLGTLGFGWMEGELSDGMVAAGWRSLTESLGAPSVAVGACWLRETLLRPELVRVRACRR